MYINSLKYQYFDSMSDCSSEATEHICLFVVKTRLENLGPISGKANNCFIMFIELM